MIKMNVQHEPLTLSQLSPSDLAPAHRLVLVVTRTESDLTFVTRRIWDLAHATGAQVLFLGLCNAADQEPTLRRTLVTASALMNSGGVASDSEILITKEWVHAVQSRLQRGDMVVCCQDSGSPANQKALSPILHTNLGVPLYILSKAKPAIDSHTEWLPTAAAWVGSIAIIVAFFWLQVQITHLPDEWSTALYLLSMAAEFGLIWGWNRQLK